MAEEKNLISSNFLQQKIETSLLQIPFRYTTISIMKKLEKKLFIIIWI